MYFFMILINFRSDPFFRPIWSSDQGYKSFCAFECRVNSTIEINQSLICRINPVVYRIMKRSNANRHAGENKNASWGRQAHESHQTLHRPKRIMRMGAHVNNNQKKRFLNINLKKVSLGTP